MTLLSKHVLMGESLEKARIVLASLPSMELSIHQIVHAHSSSNTLGSIKSSTKEHWMQLAAASMGFGATNPETIADNST